MLVREEQNAAHAASGYARSAGKPGVCIATSGPGATNLITGIATAYMDSIPLVAITGQVNSELLGRDVFQEADITGACAPFTKHSYLVKRAEDLPLVCKEAVHSAATAVSYTHLHNSLFLLEYNRRTKRERVVTNYILNDPSFVHHYFAFPSEILMVTEDGGSEVWILALEKESGHERRMARLSLLGSFCGCTALDSSRLLLWTKENDGVKELFSTYRRLTGQERVCYLCLLYTSCDEPTGALDSKTGKAILCLLQDTRRQTGRTVVVITHNQAFTAMADRVIHIRNGKVTAMETNP